MAEWGNGNNVSANVDMDSHGYKLRVSGDVSGNNWQCEVENTNANRQALLVKGKAQFRDGSGNTRGTIVPNASLNQLDINSESDSDPDVQIGRGASIQSGNVVRLSGKHIWIGGTAAEDFYRTAIAGPVMISGQVDIGSEGILYPAGGVKTPSVDAYSTNTELLLGSVNADSVRIAHSGVLTRVEGGLRVSGQTSLWDTLNLNANDINQAGAVNAMSVMAVNNVTSGGNITATGAVSGATLNGIIPNLDVNGDDVSGDLTVHGNLNVTDLTSSGNLSTLGDLSAGGNLLCNEAQCTGLSVSGESTITEVHLIYPTQMTIGGTLRFYVDETGGHNA